jgi:topoisomerase-4 subunit A
MSESLEEGSELNQNSVEKKSSRIVRVSGMYEDYFLDYASYVILERAVPAQEDGLKPVQRRLLHAMDDLHDGRYHKVANLIGHTMKYHPHGDASIGDALVQLGQKDLLIDCQGNWGNILTGDSAAAPRYIEARLTPFAREVVYQPKITEWQQSYDGRNKEPVNLPVRFPLLLAQGVEGIAVGLSTRILPHNFNELIDASISHLRGKKFELYPDFPTGGHADVSNYNDGLKGGKVRIRACIQDNGNRTLSITEIPFGTTTGSLIESILKANDKGKIKIKKIEDNTARDVEILIHLPTGLSVDKTIDALFAFTDCEVSVSPLSCVVYADSPVFQGVSEILRQNTDYTVKLLREELEIKLHELQEQWHFASLERIFIRERIYRNIEEATSWEEVIEIIRKGLKPFIGDLLRDVTDEDIVRLTEIRIKRITKFDSDKAEDYILRLEGDMDEVKNHLAHLVEYAITWYKSLKKKYGAGKERKTELRVFDDIEATRVAIANVKLYINREEGFIGTGLKKDEYLFDCSDIDDIIVFRRDGGMMVTKVDQKTFVGKDIIHAQVFKKGDERTVYNLIYHDGASGRSFVKRFRSGGVTRDKEYDLTSGTPKSKVLYFTANPNGEAEVVSVHLRSLQKLKKLKFDLDFSELAIKGRSAKGNIVSRYPIKKIELKEEGVSTLGARKIWHDHTVNRLNVDERGELLGNFKGEDKIVEINKKGQYRLLGLDISVHLDDDTIALRKWDEAEVYTMAYFDGEKDRHYLKRFHGEELRKPEFIISEDDKSEVNSISTRKGVEVELIFKKERGKDQRPSERFSAEEFIAVKGIKARGKQLSTYEIKEIILHEPEIEEPEEIEEEKASPEEVNSKEQTRLDEEGQITLEL